MKRASSAQIYLMALTLIGLTGLMLAESWVIRAALLLITVICGYSAFKLESSRLEEKALRELKENEQNYHANVVQIVNRLRHDWMNDIQILFGYIQLKKFDNLQPYMEKIKINMQQESNLSKLGIPALITYLFMFRVQSKSLQLEIGLDQEVNLQQLPLRVSLIEEMVRRTIELLKKHALTDLDEVGVISLEFDVQEDHLLLDFVYEGPYDRNGLQEDIALVQKLGTSAEYSIDQQELQEDEAVIALRLPFHT